MHSPAIEVAAATVAARIDVLLRTYPELSEDEVLLADALEGATDLYEVAERILAEERHAASLAEAAESRIKSLSERKARFERRQGALRSLLRGLMDGAGVQKLTLPEATINFTKPRERVEILDAEAVPSQLCRIKREPDKPAILIRLKAGEAIPGAALAFGEAALTIRTK